MSGWLSGESGWGLGGFNPNMVKLDALTHLYLESIYQDTPDASPAPGVCYGVGYGATGAWSGHGGGVAIWDDTASAWVFVEPKEGWQAQTLTGLMVFSGGSWVTPLNVYPTFTLTEKFAGTPASSQIIARWAVPNNFYTVDSGQTALDRCFGQASSEIRVGTLPSADTTLTLTRTTRIGGTATVGTVVITAAGGAQDVIDWTPSGFGVSIAGGSFLDIVAPAGSLNGMADIYATIVLGAWPAP